jgi:hypothetical protein
MGMRWLAVLILICAVPAAALAVPSLFEPVRDGVHVVRDDSGFWAQDYSNGVSHMNAAPYQAKKILDLSAVPADVWAAVRSVRVSAYMVVRDYSLSMHPPANGLDEAFEVIVNGTVHRYPDNCGAPVWNDAKPTPDWYDFEIPKTEFTRGVNEVIIHKAESDKNDDFCYVAIDQSVKRGNSAVTFDGKTWTQQQLTIPGGNGEYMVRLYLVTRDSAVRATWHPGKTPALDDPEKLVAYAGSRDGRTDASGLVLAPGQSARMEWDPRALDATRDIGVSVEASGTVQLIWFDAAGRPVDPSRVPPKMPSGLASVWTVPRGLAVSGAEVTATDAPATLTAMSLQASMAVHAIPAPIDMCPPIAAPAANPRSRAPFCQIKPGQVLLGNTGLSCRFETGDHLRLTSLRNLYTGREMVRDPAQIALFLVEVAAKRYAGSRDFRCKSIAPAGGKGFVADLELTDPGLRAMLTVRMEDEGLRLGLKLANAASKPVDFKLAFPHVAGLAVSGDPAADYYFFPWGGGIIADTPAIVRRGYGYHEAIYQVMDIFSPRLGGGLYVRTDDAEGWHKILVLRKLVAGAGQENAQSHYANGPEEYEWKNSLDAVEGLSFTYEYLRRTRDPGGDFAPADAVLAAHPGDWHVAMKAYAAWAHRVWRFRPWPSRLRSVHNMIASGWDGDMLFRDGKYRTDFITPLTDCTELMSWWDWSPLAPLSTPFDKMSSVLSAGQIKLWTPYFVKDPVTGEQMFNNNPGDYDGYNARFGGLPAFRAAIQTYQRMGAIVTLYTDPIRCDDNTEMGRAHGREWGVVGADGKYAKGYDQWTPCHDVEEYRQWVADTMKRVMRETGADGIRLDEYGWAGFTCFNKLHKHSFAETGISQWDKCLADTCRRVRAAMDEARPGSVLTTEHPGYDLMFPFLEGCITYDLTVQASPLRPLEFNAQRFFFPECRSYELDYGAVDPLLRKKFWNAVESFGNFYPAPMYATLCENEDVYQTRDCEPLAPTLARYVYANRFSGAGKTIYHLFNAAGHTVDAPVLALDVARGEHVFDLLAGREVTPERSGGKSAVRLYLARNEVACVARLPRRLEATRSGSALLVTVRPTAAGCVLAVCDADGKRLLSADARGAQTRLDLSSLKSDAKPVCVKLLKGRYVVDAAEIPRMAGK